MDWYLLLTPLLVLALLVPFVFLGCEPFDEAEGLPSDVTLNYGHALAWFDDPQSSVVPVSTKRINALSVQWTLLRSGTEFEKPPPDKKGSDAIPVEGSDVPFVLQMAHYDSSGRATHIDCECAVFLEDQSTFTTQLRADYQENRELHFRLVRNRKDTEDPNYSRNPFFLTSETVEN